MNPARIRLIHKMILLENNIGLLYACFGEQFPEDRPFWKKLAIEESNHASLLFTHLEYILDSKELSEQLLSAKEETLAAINERVEKLIFDLRTLSLSREDAFGVALQLEQSAGEIHFQNTTDKNGAAVPFFIFESLSSADKDHVRKITEYMNGQTKK